MTRKQTTPPEKNTASKPRRSTRAQAGPASGKASTGHRRGKAAVPAEPQKLTITHDDIATLAFSYWERRGYQGGSPQDDWNRAEEELLSLLRER